MKLYSIIYGFFDCLSCKTKPDDFDPTYDYSDEENEEIQSWPYQFFMVR
jgi:hypothetical protein